MRLGSLFLSASLALTHATGGTEFRTTHSLNHPIPSSYTVFEETLPAKEFHFHVYWFQTNQASFDVAMQIRQELLARVANKTFVVVLNGVTAEMIPNLNTSNIPNINTQPMGPHPCGSYEVWTPREHLAEVMSYFMLNRRDLTILFHPLTNHAVEDHSGRAMWLGPPYRIDFTVLDEGGDPNRPETWGDPPQYPELKLGYSAPSSPLA